MRKPQGAVLPTLGLLAAMLLWAGSFIATKIALRDLPPLLVVFSRMFLASLIFAFLARRLRRFDYRPGDWKPLLFMALCEPCLYFVSESYALGYTSASQAGMITSLLPLLVAVAAWPLLGEALRPRALSGCLLAIAGAVWLSVIGSPDEDAPNPLLGNFLEFLAMVCATGYTISLKRLSVRYSPLFLTAVQAVVGCVFFLPAAIWQNAGARWTTDAILAVLYLSVGVTILAYGFYNYGVSKIPAGKASAFINLIPVFTLGLAWLFLDEQLTPWQYVAAGVIFLGVWISRDAPVRT